MPGRSAVREAFGGAGHRGEGLGDGFDPGGVAHVAQISDGNRRSDRAIAARDVEDGPRPSVLQAVDPAVRTAVDSDLDHGRVTETQQAAGAPGGQREGVADLARRGGAQRARAELVKAARQCPRVRVGGGVGARRKQQQTDRDRERASLHWIPAFPRPCGVTVVSYTVVVMSAQGSEPPAGAEAPSEEELQRRLEEQVRKLRVQDLLTESVVSILNLAARRIAKEDERDLEQGRIGIEAVRALVDLLDEAPREQVREALSQVQMLYVRETQGNGEPGEAGDGTGGEPAAAAAGTGTRWSGAAAAAVDPGVVITPPVPLQFPPPRGRASPGRF